MFHYLRRRRLCFHFGVFVCLSVCWITEKVVNGFSQNFLGGVGHGPGTDEFNFGDNPDHCPDPGVRNPHSLDCRKTYQRIFMKFYGELGCDLETNWLNPNHRPDPEVRSPKSGFTDYRLCWRSAEVCALWALLVDIMSLDFVCK